MVVGGRMLLASIGPELNMTGPVNILRAAVERQEAFLEQRVSEWAVYRPAGAQRTAKIRVTPVGTGGDADQANSMRIESATQDFLIRVATQVNCTAETFVRWLGREPEQNDELLYDGQRYQVTALFGGEPFRYQNAFRTTLRIHTTHAGAK